MFTLRSQRLRRGPYALATPEGAPRMLLRIASVIVVAGIALFLVRGFLRWAGSNNLTQRSAVIVTVEASPVSVAIEGGSLKRAEDSIKLYDGDRIETGAGGRARLLFYDGSSAVTDESSSLTIEESARGSEESALHVRLSMGGLWLRTTGPSAVSGSILITIETSSYSATIPPNAEAVFRDRSLVVFSADGLGISVMPNGARERMTIGEGQEWDMPSGADMDADLYTYRSPISASASKHPLVIRGRSLAPFTSTNTKGNADSVPSGALTITAPTKNAVVAGETVLVEGRVDTRVDRVRVNGFQAAVDHERGTFSQQLSLPVEEVFSLHVEAIDDSGIVIAEEQRTVMRISDSVPVPLITNPSPAGSTYRTQQTEVLIKGTTETRVEAIVVNDYRLQLYEPGNETWTYVASTALGNLTYGSNTYDVVAIDAAGRRSVAARMTVLLEDGTEGVIVERESGSRPSSPIVVDDESLSSQNAPLLPGTLAVIAPSSGKFHTETGTGDLLIEGTTAPQTASVWVNGYQLQLYQAGKTTWNYIAAMRLQTLRPGANTYLITARNDKGEIVDRMEYVIRYRP